MGSFYDSQDSFESYEPPDTFDYSQVDDTEVVDVDGEGAINGDSPRHQSPQSQLPQKLVFCQLTDWDEDKAYDEDPPSCVHYSIEWKVTVNNRVVSKDTEPDVVLAPGPYWRLILQPKLERLLGKKLARNRPVKSEDTSVVASVTERSQRDLTKRFDDTDINWAIIEKQLLKWAELFRAGKKLRLNIAFNYVETSQATASKRVDKRGASSVTQQMLSERNTQLDAEQGTSEPSVWRQVYHLMRCPGAPCHLGPHCWRDPDGKKHYKLKTHHLKSIIRHVEQGNELNTHDDVPESIRQQLYAEEQQWVERRQKQTGTSAPNFPPINITNVLPPQSSQSSTGPSQAVNNADPLSIAPEVTRLEVPGLRDVAVKTYSKWQQSNVDDDELKLDFQKACDVTLADGLDLEQLHEDQDFDFLIGKGVKRGIARRFVRDIDRWVKKHKRSVVEGRLD